MNTLQECIDDVLEDAGFAKSALPHPGMGSAFAVSRHAPSAAPVSIPSAAAGETPPSKRGGSRINEASVTPTISSPSGLNQFKNASSYDLVGRYRRIMREKVAGACGLRAGSDLSKTFGASDTLNILKLAGFADRMLNAIPAETSAYVAGAARSALGGYSPQALVDAEKFLIGRAMQEAGAAVDPEKARRIFESLGGHPQISYDDLATLAMKARDYDSMTRRPYSTPAVAGLGIGLGGLAGLAAGYYATKDRERQRPTMLLTGGRFNG
jgi:hypothetical protein